LSPLLPLLLTNQGQKLTKAKVVMIASALAFLEQKAKVKSSMNLGLSPQLKAAFTNIKNKEVVGVVKQTLIKFLILIESQDFLREKVVS
jgi:hypothetical protein